MMRLYVRKVPVVLKKSILADERKFLGPLMSFERYKVLSDEKKPRLISDEDAKAIEILDALGELLDIVRGVLEGDELATAGQVRFDKNTAHAASNSLRAWSNVSEVSLVHSRG